MKVTIRIQRRCWAWGQPADEAAPVWKPTGESFLSTLIGCTKDQSEEPTQEEVEAAEIAELLAKEVAYTESAEEERDAQEPVVEEEIPVAAAAQQTGIPGATPFVSSWTFQNATTIFPKVGAEDAVRGASLDTIPAMHVEEAPARPTADEQNNIAAEEPASPPEICPEPARTVAEELKPEFADYTFVGDESENTVEDTPEPAASSEPFLPALEEVRPEEVLAASAPEVQESVAARDTAPAVNVRENFAREAEAEAIAIREAEHLPEQAESKTPLVMPSRPKQSAVAANGILFRAWRWINTRHSLGAKKQLRVAETISLGDKRFVAVVHVDGQKFLIGGGASGVSLLTSLGGLVQTTEAGPALSAVGSELA